jgi:hypothetical protein
VDGHLDALSKILSWEPQRLKMRDTNNLSYLRGVLMPQFFCYSMPPDLDSLFLSRLVGG